MDGKLAILGVVVALVAVVMHFVRLQRGRHSPLSNLAGPVPPEPDLGMEATDLAAVRGSLDRNDALARKTGAEGARASWTEVGAASGPSGKADRQ